MKKLYFLLLFISFYGFGQCPSDEIVLSSQAEVDAFAVNYPNCTELNGSLTISGNDITDLTPLSMISKVESLSINDNLALTNLNGLNIIENEGAVFIDNNSLLQSISALNVMTSETPGNYFPLIIQNNPVLASLDGLQNFQTSYITRIDNNDSLVDLTGLQILSIEELYVTRNDNLLSFNGLSGDVPIQIYVHENLLLNNISEFNNLNFNPLLYPLLSILDNPNLTTCNVIPFCESIFQYYEAGGFPISSYNIQGNDIGCNSIGEVAVACGITPSNDNCENAIYIELGQMFSAYNALGTQSPQIPSCNDSANRIDVWFSFTTGNEGIFDVVVEDGVYNLQLWEGDCNNLTQVPDACGVNQVLDANVQFNTDYYIQVWSDGTGRAAGALDVTVYNTTLSIQEDEFNAFELFPNPVNSSLQFKAANEVNSISVLNALGQNVMFTFPKSTNGVLDVSALSSGMYFVKVEINNRFSTFKVIKD